jgi:endothelin-converting enzyme/putative endopeptidase
LLATALLCAAVGTPAQQSPGPLPELPYSPSLDLSAMDRNADPCEDLYTYACGGWERANPIPPDQTSWSVYGKLQVDNQRYLWGLLEEAARPRITRTANEQKIGDYFAACMDVNAIEERGVTPIAADRGRIDALTDKRQLAPLLGELHPRIAGSGLFFSSAVEQDGRDASKVIAAVYPGGLGLPDRDYYFKSDAKSQEIRARYRAHVARMLTLAGEPAPAADADAAVVMRIETQLARATLTAVARRDPYQIYHHGTVARLQELAPDFDWKAYFAGAGLNPQPWLNISEPAFVRALNARIKGESLQDLKTYLRWALIDATAPYLSSAFVEESYTFNRAYLLGAKADRPRWRKCVAWTDRDLAEALGQAFVARTFSAATRTQALRLTQQIEAAMRQRIEALDWMSPNTKAQALEKLAAMRNKIGYPEHWRDYSALTIERGEFYGNVERAASFESQRQAAKIGKPVDRDEWFISPATVNAYYDPQLNDVNFPAGVLLPPLFDPKMDDAPNYGDTGGTIGHELTHGFDDEGRQFDAAGNLRDWWTASDARTFNQRAQCVRDQYAQYTIVDDIKVNSALTEGEDIADLGGELLAYMAWQEQTRGLTLPERDGMSPEQRFFVGFAQWACSNDRPERLRADAIVDPHSPARARINGVVSNMPQFARAFHCHTGQALVKPADKVCRVW